jgi:hypothetical protein
LIVLLPLGCGPIGATSVIAEAEVATARAHAAEGDKYALYETTAADLYLQKAREEQGYAQYSDAMDLARRSADLANAATKKAIAAKKEAGTPPPLPPATIQRPVEAPAPGPAPVPPPPLQLAPAGTRVKEPIQPEDHK